MDALGGFAKILGPLLGAMFPWARRRLKERSAGKNPERVSQISDHLLKSAFERLGALDPNHAFWTQCLKGAEATLVRPDAFQKPALRQWLTLPTVQGLFKQAVEARIAGLADPPDVFQELAAEYANATGEDSRLASGPILIAVAFIQESIQGAVRDPGTAAIVQSSASALKRQFDSDMTGLIEAAGLSRNPHVAERATAEAREELEKILRRRATPGQKPGDDLEALLADLQEGRRFAAADRAVRFDAKCWLARVLAGVGDPEGADALLRPLVDQGFQIPEVARALVDLANNRPDSALIRLRDRTDAESQSAVFFIVLKSSGAKAALRFADGLQASEPGAFTPIGWNGVCATLIGEGQIDRAAAILAGLPLDVRAGCTQLAYLHAVCMLLPMLPLGRRESLLNSGFAAVAEHLLDSEESRAAVVQARQAAEEALEIARRADDELVAQRSEIGVRSLRLIDPTTKVLEEASIRNDMCEGANAVRLIWLARAYGVGFDAEPLERHLDRAQSLGGLTEDQLRARLYLLNVPARSAELVRFLDEEWATLMRQNNPEALVAMRVQALAKIGDVDGATAFLEVHRSSLDDAVAPRLELMLKEARGEDPSDAAIALFNGSGAIEDLLNVVHILESKKSWKRLAPFSEELYELEPNFESAMLRHKCMKASRASPQAICDFLETATRQVDSRPELRAARAWSLYEVGEHQAAKIINDELLAVRQEPNDIALDINIAIRTGDWERFAIIGAKAWDLRNRLDSRMLLSLAKLVGFSDQSRALSLAVEAVSRDGDDPAVLIGAHSVAIAARRDDLAMPWVQKAAELSKEGGPISTFSHRELVEFMRNGAESWKHKNDLYRTGQVPLHMAASMFNAPLSQMLIAIPRQNAANTDARQWHPVPFRSGSRIPVGNIEARRAALDITALFLLSEFGLLSQVMDLFEEVHVSPRTMEVLLEDRQKAAFHQPSRVAEVKPLVGFVNASRMTVVDDRGEDSLIAEVGDEAASLLAAASKLEGRYVHPGRIFEVSSLMEKEASIGNEQRLLADPIDIANALREEGVITAAACEAAIDALLPTGGLARGAITQDTPLFLDGLSVQYLHQVKLLKPLLNSRHSVFVHRSTVDEWQALLATEPMAEELIAAVDALRQTVREGLVSGKVKFLPQSRRQRGELSATSLLPVFDLLADCAEVDVAVLDDRHLGGNQSLTDSGGKTIQVLSSLDVLDELVKRGSVTAARRREIVHSMRARCLFCVPLGSDELRDYLSAARACEGTIRETAELRVIRQYLARLNSADVLCTPADLAFQEGLWRVGTYVITKIWSEVLVPIPDAIAMCDWIFENVVPEVDLVLRFSDDPSGQMVMVAAAQVHASVLVAGSDRARREACQAWYDRRFLARYLPVNSDVLRAAAQLWAPDLIQRSSEIADELRSRSHQAPAQ